MKEKKMQPVLTSYQMDQLNQTIDPGESMNSYNPGKYVAKRTKKTVSKINVRPGLSSMQAAQNFSYRSNENVDANNQQHNTAESNVNKLIMAANEVPELDSDAIEVLMPQPS